IVRDKYILRQIISAATESVRRAYEEQDEVNNLLDEVEQRIFAVGDDRFKGQMLSMKDQVMEAIEAIEKLYERKGGITGISSRFKTGGSKNFHRRQREPEHSRIARESAPAQSATGRAAHHCRLFATTEIDLAPRSGQSAVGNLRNLRRIKGFGQGIEDSDRRC